MESALSINPSPNPVIPKLVHFTSNSADISKSFRQNIRRFKVLHPDWTIRLWIGTPLGIPPALLKVLYSVSGTKTSVDIIKTWLLSKYGGICMEGNVYALRSFDDLRCYSHFFIGESESKPSSLIIGASGDTDVFTSILERLKTNPNIIHDWVHRENFPGVNVFQQNIAQPNLLPSHFLVAGSNQKTVSEIAAVTSLGNIVPGVLSSKNESTGPYGIKLSQMTGFALSNHSKAKAVGDTILGRLSTSHTEMAEIGVWRGSLSAYLLNNHPELKLIMVGRWRECCEMREDRRIDPAAAHTPGASELQALQATRFAMARRRVLTVSWKSGAKTVAPESLDSIFIHRGPWSKHIAPIIQSWLPKLKPDGFICGNYPEKKQSRRAFSKLLKSACVQIGLPRPSNEDAVWFIKNRDLKCQFTQPLLNDSKNLPTTEVSTAIPQIAHFIWIGSRPPQMAYDNIERFKRFHPNWEVRLCIGLPNDLPNELAEIALSSPELCMRSDIARIWLLYQHGGVYLDTDVYMLRNIDELLSAGPFIARRTQNSVTNAVLGAAPKSDMLHRALQAILQIHKRSVRLRRTAYGPEMFNAMWDSGNPGFEVLPVHYFSLFRAHEAALEFISSSPDEQKKRLQTDSRIPDGIVPFGIHTGGIPTPTVNGGMTRSSWTKQLPAADAILLRLANRPARGAIVGIFDEYLPGYLLGHNSQLELTMFTMELSTDYSMNFWNAQSPSPLQKENEQERNMNLLNATDFSSERRFIINQPSAEAIEAISNETFDFIFFLGSAKASASLWLPKLKPSAILCGWNETVTDSNFDIRATIQRHFGRPAAKAEVDVDGTWFITLP